MFRSDYRDTNFTPKAQGILDEVHRLATTYNEAAEAARQTAIPNPAALRPSRH
jgi:hypothetical protein